MKQSLKLIISLVFLLFVNTTNAQNGKILSKGLVDISETPVWRMVSENDVLKPDYEHLNRLDFYAIIYESDGLKVRGIIVEPKAEGKYPVVIFNRGGNRDYGQLTIGTMVMVMSKLAAEGYVIIGSNYRTNDEFGGVEINDVLCLTETVKEIEKADDNCIGMMGWSRGGMMTYLSLKNSTKIKTAVVGNGVADLSAEIDFRPKMEAYVYAQCIPNYWENKDAELKKRSVIYWADELNKNSSLLILCGTKDTKVNPKQADLAANKLSEIGYNYELRKFETDHRFSDKRKELNDLLIEWFNKELKNHCE